MLPPFPPRVCGLPVRCNATQLHTCGRMVEETFSGFQNFPSEVSPPRPVRVPICQLALLRVYPFVLQLSPVRPSSRFPPLFAFPLLLSFDCGPLAFSGFKFSFFLPWRSLYDMDPTMLSSPLPPSPNSHHISLYPLLESFVLPASQPPSHEAENKAFRTGPDQCLVARDLCSRITEPLDCSVLGHSLFTTPPTPGLVRKVFTCRFLNCVFFTLFTSTQARGVNRFPFLISMIIKL